MSHRGGMFIKAPTKCFLFGINISIRADSISLSH